MHLLLVVLVYKADSRVLRPPYTGRPQDLGEDSDHLSQPLALGNPLQG